VDSLIHLCRNPSDEIARQITRVRTPSDTNDAKLSTRCKKVRHSAQPDLGVEVVRGGNRHDQIEGLQLEWVVKNVTDDKGHVGFDRLISSPADARLVRVDAHHRLAQRRQLTGQHATAAPDVQRSVRRGQREQHLVIVDVSVPPVIVRRHVVRLSHRAPLTIAATNAELVLVGT